MNTPTVASDPRAVRFHFDLLSHNAYLAWTQIHALAAKYGLRVIPVPVVFGVLLKHNGQLGPAEVPPKSRWMLKDVLRKAARLNVPIRPPVVHPFNPLLALRMASLPMDEATRIRAVDGLFRAVWAEGKDVMQPEVVAGIAQAAGLDGATAIAGAMSDEGKERLRVQTGAAIEAGVFGVPTMIVDDELFFGFDDFAHLDAFLAGRDNLDKTLLAEFQTPRPAFRRKEDPRA